MFTNNVNKDIRYNSLADNVASVTDPYNIMICPIIDKDDQFDLLKAPKTKEINKKVSIKQASSEEIDKRILGIIQFTNKTDKSLIDDYDLLKYDVINQLVVIAIRSVKDMRTFLNLTLAHSNSL